ERTVLLEQENRRRIQQSERLLQRRNRDRSQLRFGICRIGSIDLHGASGLTSPAKDAGNFALSSSRKPSTDGRIGGTGAAGGGSLISEDTDSPLSSAKAAI